MEKFYTILDDTEKKYLSLNFLLSEKIIITSNIISPIFLKTEVNPESEIHFNKEFVCTLFHKHISRYIQDLEGYKKENL